MCSINGVYTTKAEGLNADEWAKFVGICKEGENRGRDSYGVESFDKDGMSLASARSVGGVNTKLVNSQFRAGIKLALANNRAEPTTEYVKDKNPKKDVQPYTGPEYRFTIVHNGTIANDKELIKKYDLKLQTSIDSAVIPAVLEKHFKGKVDITANDMAKALNDEFIGSYSLIIYDRDNPEELFLAANYKPLFIERFGDTLFFTSLREFFGKTHGLDSLHRNIAQLDPYTVVKISGGKLNVATLRKPIGKKALVVCSGGLDSVTAAKIMQNRGFEVTLLHFQYQCRAEVKEVQAIKDVAEELGTEVLFVPTGIFKDVIKHSPLVDEGETEVAKGDKGVEFAHEWVAARNLIMLAMSTGIAEAHGYDYLVLGNNLEESGAYPDNEEIFIKKFAEILPYAVNVNKSVEIAMPVGNLMKHEIVRVALDEGAPIHKTWSCYEAGEKHCGECGPCRMRRVAFEMLEKPDPIEYLN